MKNINEDLSKEKCKTLANYLCMYVRSQLKSPFTDLPQLMIGGARENYGTTLFEDKAINTVC